MARRKALQIDSVTVGEKVRHLEDSYAHHYPQHLHKELWGQNDGDPNRSLYHRWWEFMQAAEMHPALIDEVIQDGNAKEQAKLRKAFQRMQKIFYGEHKEFMDWWRAVGVELFKEQSIPLIELIEPRENPDEVFNHAKHLVISLPLTVSRELLCEQFNILLDVYHPGNQLRRHAHSTAELKIYPAPRYDERNYHELIEFWQYVRTQRAQEAQTPMWELYCQFTGDNDLRIDLAQPDNIDGRNKIGKQAKDLYDQADDLIKNAIIGEFPNDKNYQKRKRGKKK